ATLGFGGTWFPIVGAALILVVSVAGLLARAPWRRVIPQAILATYAVFAIDLTLLPVYFDLGARTMYRMDWAFWQRSVNLVPFQTMIAQLAPGAPPTAVPQILGNLALMFPFGVLAPVVFPRLHRARSFLISALCVGVGIEALQLLEKVTLISRRSIDVDDVILNVAGALLGFFVWDFVHAVVGRQERPEGHARLLSNPGVNLR
ncbi:MAG: VanZ family protein, partial [Coriobacteriia bacterium]|nr:VanZ family protein [Coriobacteriia bacterium]